MNDNVYCYICDSPIAYGAQCAKCHPPTPQAKPGKVYRPMQRSVEHTELLEASKRRWLVEQGETETSYQTKVIALQCRAKANGRTVAQQALAEMREKNPVLTNTLEKKWRNAK